MFCLARACSCFQKLVSYELPHPGMDVTEDPEFDGTISTIRKEFNFMARRYVERLFNEHLVPKFVCGRKVSALTPARPLASLSLAARCQPH